jgi:signal transduction histidine kinase
VNIYQITLIVVAFTNLFIGLFVFTRGVNQQINRRFFVFTFFMSLWMTSLFILSLVPYEKKSLATDLLLLLHTGLVFMHSTYFHFVVTLVGDKGEKNRILVYIGYATSLFLLLMSILGFLDQRVEFTTIGYFPRIGPAGFLFIPILLSFLSYSNYLLYRAYRATPSPFEKNSYRYLFLGIIVIFISALTNIAAVLGFRVYPVAHIGILFFNLMTALAIIRYRLMDINIILRTGMAYSALTALVTAIWLSCIFFFEKVFNFETTLSQILTMAIFIFIFNILREKVQFIVDKLFYRQKQELSSLQKKVTEEIAANYDPDLLVPHLMNQIKDNLHCKFISCMLREKDIFPVKYIVGNGEENVSISADNPLIQWLSMRKREIFYRETDDNPQFDGPRKEIKNGFEKTGARLIVPLIHRDGMIGILNLGEKKGNESYTYDEIGFLNTMSKELSLSLENSKLHVDLKIRAKELEKANQDKSDFLNIVSHELRTPLTFIIAQLELFKRETFGKITKSQKESIKRIEEKGYKLNSIITDILNLAAIESGKTYDIKREKVYLKKVIDEATKSFGLMIYHKGLNLKLCLPERLSSVISDSEKINDILFRLLDNALKFTSSGGEITIEAKEAREAIEISVSDTGVGIAKDEQERIFERFYQADHSITRKYSGIGLGLGVASELTKALGCRLELSSKQGKGSRFTLIIPKINKEKKE